MRGAMTVRLIESGPGDLLAFSLAAATILGATWTAGWSRDSLRRPATHLGWGGSVAKLSDIQVCVLGVIANYRAKWWEAEEVTAAWSSHTVPRSARGVGMALRGLWKRGIVERQHGPPASYRLTKDGAAVARGLA